MSATDELRKMLDERGVEWMPSVFDPQYETFYSTENGVGFIVTEFPEIGRMSLACDMRITPEQAVAATLGAGTCEMEYVNDWMGWHCKSCNNLRMGLPDQKPKYCPNCGARVVEVSS